MSEQRDLSAVHIRKATYGAHNGVDCPHGLGAEVCRQRRRLWWAGKRRHAAHAFADAGRKPARRYGEKAGVRKIMSEADIFLREAVSAVNQDHSREWAGPVRTRDRKLDSVAIREG